jgi:hypothetical protein
VADDLGGLYAVRDLLGESYRLLISDTAGNDERAAFVYDADKVELLELVGRLSIPVDDLRHVKLPGVEQEFRGFDRSPYLAAFQAGSFRFVLRTSAPELPEPEGYGHLSFQNPSACVDQATVDYLTELITPPKGTVCQSDQQPFDSRQRPPLLRLR